MTKISLTLFICTILLYSCKDDDVVGERVYLEKDSAFEKTYGGTESDELNSIVEQNNFLYSLGYSNSFGDIDGDFYLVKIDLNGNSIWEKTFGSPQLDVGYKIIKSTDGNLLLLGATEKASAGNRDIQLYKVDTDGNLIWEKSWGGAGQEIAATLIETSNSKLLVAATTTSIGNGGRDMYLTWLNSQGDVLREKTFGRLGDDGANDLLEIENGRLMVFGYTSSYGATSRDFYLLQLTANGDSLWGKRYGGSDYEESWSILRTDNNNYLLHGHSAKTDPNHNMYSILVDSLGNTIWEQEYGGGEHDGGHSALINANGNFILLGRSMSFGQQRQMIFVEHSESGNLISQEDFGTAKNDWGNEVIEVGNSYYIIGHSDGFSDHGDNDGYLIRKLK